jgi:hypothetical protein
MKRAVVLSLLLAGCQSNAQPAPEPPLTECQAMAKALSIEGGDPFLKQAVLEKMRNRGCLR